jgi:CRP-like cAMP-binding protein
MSRRRTEPIDEQARAVLQRRFERATPEALELLLRHSTLRTYPSQAVLCYQGQQEERFSIIVEGQLDIFMDQETGRTFVAYLRVGRSLGGLEYITRTPRVADAVAAEPVTVLEMSFADLDTVIRTDPEILREISRETVAELIESQDRFIRLSSASNADAAEHVVFISYARADVEFAKQLTAGLRRLGVMVWLDVYSITAGKSWARQVGEALDRCELMLLILSPRSMASDNSDDEWNYFLDKKKPVIPALYEQADVRYRLNKLQYIDFTTQPFDSG